MNIIINRPDNFDVCMLANESLMLRLQHELDQLGILATTEGLLEIAVLEILQ